ncbi:MAG TPA: DUF2807 domain-containing protein [Bacteroidales bacterium]|nr:DUF2807 domain-containing protein [Bacteroidales bacterium]
MKKEYLFLVFIFIGVTSCKKENLCDCFKSTGKITTEERTTEPFNSIYLDDNVNLILTRDSIFSVKAEAGKNLLPLIRTRVENGSMYISNDNKCNWVRSYKPDVNVYISMPSLLFLGYSGSGDITMQNTFTGDTLWFDSKNGSGTVNLDLEVRKCCLIINTGPCDVITKGCADELQVYYIGTGMIHCEEFPTFYTYVTNKSTGDCYLNVHDLLIYHLSWSGNVYYTGNPPQITGESTGSGTIIPY